MSETYPIARYPIHNEHCDGCGKYVNPNDRHIHHLYCEATETRESRALDKIGAALNSIADALQTISLQEWSNQEER